VESRSSSNSDSRISDPEAKGSKRWYCGIVKLGAERSEHPGNRRPFKIRGAVQPDPHWRNSPHAEGVLPRKKLHGAATVSVTESKATQGADGRRTSISDAYDGLAVSG